MKRYILDGKEAVEVKDLFLWANWMETSKRLVQRTDIKRCTVSTVFLGIDHNLVLRGNPVLFETMIFGLPDTHQLSGYQERYETYDDAVKGHERAVNLVKTQNK